MLLGKKCPRNWSTWPSGTKIDVTRMVSSAGAEEAGAEAVAEASARRVNMADKAFPTLAAALIATAATEAPTAMDPIGALTVSEQTGVPTALVATGSKTTMAPAEEATDQGPLATIRVQASGRMKTPGRVRATVEAKEDTKDVAVAGRMTTTDFSSSEFFRYF